MKLKSSFNVLLIYPYDQVSIKEVGGGGVLLPTCPCKRGKRNIWLERADKKKAFRGDVK